MPTRFAHNLFLNFIDPTSGTARINGLDVTQVPLENQAYVAYIPEQVMLYRNLTGLENLEYFSALAGHEYRRVKLVELSAVARRVLVASLGPVVPAAGIGWLGLRRLRRYPIVG